jgi:hypothetical protein
MSRISDYRSEYCDMLIEHRGTGGTLESFAGSIGITRPTLYNWIKKYPEFKEAKEIAHMAAIHFSSEVGIRGITGKIPNFNGRLWVWNHRNLMQPIWDEEKREKARNRVIVVPPRHKPKETPETEKPQLQED